MKKIKISFVIVVIIMMVLPIINFNLESPSVSSIDNRNLTELDFSSGDKTEIIDSYIKDRIGYRTQAINSYTKWNDEVFNKMVHPTYTYGKNGNVFFKVEEENVDFDFVEEFCKYLKRIQTYCEEREVPFIYCLNPGKISVYSEELPKGYNYKNQFVLEMKKSLEKYNINYVDNYEVLKEKCKTEQVFNKKYDAGHWNDLGAFYGINSILNKMNEYFPEVTENKIVDFKVGSKIEESLPVSYFEINEEVPVFENINAEDIENITRKYEKIRINESHPYFLCIENKKGEELPDILFFRGSYMNGKSKFLESKIKKGFFVHNYENLLDFEYYFNIAQPDCVIIETAEYATTRNYFNYDKMVNKAFNSKLKLEDMDKARKLSEYEYKIEKEGALVTISLEGVEHFSRGYLYNGEQEFDFELDAENGKIRCTIDEKYYDEQEMKVILY